MQHVNPMTISGVVLCVLSFGSLFYPPARKRWLLLAPSLVFGLGTAGLLGGFSPDLVAGPWSDAKSSYYMLAGVGAVMAWGFFWIVDIFTQPPAVTQFAEAEVVVQVAAPVAAVIDAADTQEAEASAQPVPAPVALAADTQRAENPLAKITKAQADGRTVTVTFTQTGDAVEITITAAQYGDKSFYNLVRSKLEAQKGFAWSFGDKKNKVRVTTGKAALDRLAEIRAVLKTIG
jgi:hypothetical protein